MQVRSYDQLGLKINIQNQPSTSLQIPKNLLYTESSFQMNLSYLPIRFV